MLDHTEADNLEGPLWRMPGGEPLSCREKVRTLNAAYTELQALASELLADAVVMGCDETVTKEIMKASIDALPPPFSKKA